MHSDAMSQEVSDFFKEADRLQWKKNKDYHPERIAFLEILRTACETGITVEQDLWAKIRKQYVALRSYVLEGTVASESPRSRMTDIAVYMGMFAFWAEHKQTILLDAFYYMRDQPCEVFKGNAWPSTEGSTCVREGKARDRCDRCRFVMWLNDNAAPNS